MTDQNVTYITTAAALGLAIVVALLAVAIL